MTQASFLKLLSATAVAFAMLLAVSGVTIAQADGPYTEPSAAQTTDPAGTESPGIPDTGASTADPIAVTLLVLVGVAVVGGAAYLLMAPRDAADQI